MLGLVYKLSIIHNSSFNNFLADGKIAGLENRNTGNISGNLPNEEWVDAFGYDGYIRLSSLGRMKSLQGGINLVGAQNCSEKILKQIL